MIGWRSASRSTAFSSSSARCCSARKSSNSSGSPCRWCASPAAFSSRRWVGSCSAKAVRRSSGRRSKPNCRRPRSATVSIRHFAAHRRTGIDLGGADHRQPPSYLSYRFAGPLARFLGKAGIKVMVPLSAFILTCIGVQIAWTGVPAPIAGLPIRRSLLGGLCAFGI